MIINILISHLNLENLYFDGMHADEMKWNGLSGGTLPNNWNNRISTLPLLSTSQVDTHLCFDIQTIKRFISELYRDMQSYIYI